MIAPHELDQLILKNANRLLADAELMFANGRYASAFCLALIALEEIGKLIHRKWATLAKVTRMQGTTWHERKQAVVGALYASEIQLDGFRDYMVKVGRELGFESDLAAVSSSYLQSMQAIFDPDNERMNEHILRHVEEHKSELFLNESLDGGMEEAKKISLYVDDGNAARNLTPFSLEERHAAKIVEYTKRAIRLAHDPVLVALAKDIYENNVAKPRAKTKKRHSS